MTLYLCSGESFYASALKAYIDRFEFGGNPLDVALRKLLMDVGLPRETQQIDRVIEAFASRYLTCNRSLFISDGMSLYHHEICRHPHRRKIIPISLPSA
jgi:Sec7-like guanine-nucleotide exchange factor